MTLRISSLHSRPGVSLIELLTVIAIIGILAAILLSVVGSVRESTQGAACACNVRQMLKEIHFFAGDHGGQDPAPQDSASGGGGRRSPEGGTPSLPVFIATLRTLPKCTATA